MGSLRLTAPFVLTVALLGFYATVFAQQQGESLLDTIIKEAIQPSPPSESRYSDDDQDGDYYNDRHYDSRQGRRITCESRSGQHSYCPTEVRGRARLDRQLSDAPCRQYDTWGMDGDGGGIWVSDGCRAVFVVEPRRPRPPSYGGGGGGGKTITCESRSGRYNYCRTNMSGRLRLERQLSDAPCREYSTWGSDGDGSGVWVSDGCRAVFSVDSRAYGGGYPERRGRLITCKSENYGQNYCRTDTHGNVRLERQLSEASCREDSTWGSDRDGGGIWVDQGCAGEFSVR